jgi:predicted heme/steroid binding protein
MSKNLPLILGAVTLTLLIVTGGVVLFFTQETSKMATAPEVVTQQTSAGSDAVTISSGTSNNQSTSMTTNTSTTATSGSSTGVQKLTLDELSKFNGLNGAKCYLVVDKIVYDATNFDLFMNGFHTPSRSTVKCGTDASAEIDKSPHGRSKLAIMTKVGELQ